MVLIESIAVAGPYLIITGDKPLDRPILAYRLDILKAAAISVIIPAIVIKKVSVNAGVIFSVSRR